MNVRYCWEYNMTVAMERNSKDMHGIKPMPPIVIIIDDLEHILTKETEACIVRIAQIGGLMGIHLIINASPSAVTPLIKANFETRLDFVETGKMLFYLRRGDKGHLLYSFLTEPETVQMVLEEAGYVRNKHVSDSSERIRTN